ncbi:hypothetical protein VCSRO193_2569 [Vibrio cholerae]|nr:hypothetical protein VCSRO193_2569 [Vibrio cholerae]GHZ42002.1 hypothetical protein VCSRO173_3201 [Vibrio cholerae]
MLSGMNSLAAYLQLQVVWLYLMKKTAAAVFLLIPNS